MFPGMDVTTARICLRSRFGACLFCAFPSCRDDAWQWRCPMLRCVASSLVLASQRRLGRGARTARRCRMCCANKKHLHECSGTFWGEVRIPCKRAACIVGQHAVLPFLSCGASALVCGVRSASTGRSFLEAIAGLSSETCRESDGDSARVARKRTPVVRRRSYEHLAPPVLMALPPHPDGARLLAAHAGSPSHS